MEQLPVELISAIVSICDYNTVFHLRGVNKYLREIVTLLAFEHIFVGWNPKHLKHLESLALSPLAKHVHRLTINTEILPTLGYRDWLKLMKSSMDETPPNLNDDHDSDGNIIEDLEVILLAEYTERELQALRRRYLRRAADQKREPRAMCTNLATAVRNFSGLRKLELVDRLGVHSEDDDKVLRRHSDNGMLAACSPWKKLLIDPEVHRNDLLRNWKGYHIQPNTAVLSSAYALHLIAESLGHQSVESPSAIKELSLNIAHHVPIADIFARAELGLCERCEMRPSGTETPYTAMCNMVNTLTRLNLHLSKEIFYYGSDVCFELAVIASRASNLRELQLDNRGSKYPEFFKEFARIAASAALWPELERLQLSGEAWPEDLSKIIVSSAQSLRTLELIDVCLRQDCIPRYRWDDFLERIRPSLELKSAKVRCLSVWPGRPRVVFFAEDARPRSEMNLMVERFLVKEVEVLPRQEEWDGG